MSNQHLNWLGLCSCDGCPPVTTVIPVPLHVRPRATEPARRCLAARRSAKPQSLCSLTKIKRPKPQKMATRNLEPLLQGRPPARPSS